MANESANVDIYLNGKAAEAELKRLENAAESLKNEIKQFKIDNNRL